MLPKLTSRHIVRYIKTNYLRTHRYSFKIMIHWFHFNSVERIVFNECLRFWIRHFPQQQSKYSATTPAQHIFYHPDSGWSRDQPEPGSFSQRQREAVERGPGRLRLGRIIRSRKFSRVWKRLRKPSPGPRFYSNFQTFATLYLMLIPGHVSILAILQYLAFPNLHNPHSASVMLALLSSY